MTLPLRKRTVHFYEIHLHSSTRAAIKNPSCASLVDLLKSFTTLVSSSKLPRTIRRATNLHTVLADWNYDPANNCYELLVSKANAALSDVALRDLGTTKLRKAGKTKVEGIEVSAHVLIRPNPDGRKAALLLTMGAGVATRDIELLLRLLSRIAAKDPRSKSLFYFDDPSGAKTPDGKPLQYKVQYGFAAFAHQGQTLTTALQTGQFEAMELIAHEQAKFDAGGNLEIVERSIGIHAKLPKAVTAASVRNAIRSFQKTPDGALYDKLRIHYKTLAGKRTSAILDTQNLDAAFTLKEHIEFDSDVEAQQEELNPIIVGGMKPLLQLVPS